MSPYLPFERTSRSSVAAIRAYVSEEMLAETSSTTIPLDDGWQHEVDVGPRAQRRDERDDHQRTIAATTTSARDPRYGRPPLERGRVTERDPGRARSGDVLLVRSIRSASTAAPRPSGSTRDHAMRSASSASPRSVTTRDARLAARRRSGGGSGDGLAEEGDRARDTGSPGSPRRAAPAPRSGRRDDDRRERRATSTPDRDEDRGQEPRVRCSSSAPAELRGARKPGRSPARRPGARGRTRTTTGRRGRPAPAPVTSAGAARPAGRRRGQAGGGDSTRGAGSR